MKRIICLIRGHNYRFMSPKNRPWITKRCSRCGKQFGRSTG